jgi:hypothetical protein
MSNISEATLYFFVKRENAFSGFYRGGYFLLRRTGSSIAAS